jgi:hypothetical protein
MVVRSPKHMKLRQPCHGGCFMDLSPKSGNSVPIGNFLHVTYHSIPKEYHLARFASVVVLMGIWLVFYPLPVKIRTFVAATLYTFIEYTFTTLNDGEGFTSFAQFWGNLLYTPVVLDVYWALINPNEGTFQKVVYVLLFPCNIWLLEIVLDRLYLIIHGRNVAWCYHEYSDCAVGGCIRLGHGVYWLAMGVLCLLIYEPMRDFSETFA